MPTSEQGDGATMSVSSEEDARPLMWKGESVAQYGKLLNAVRTISKIEDDEARQAEVDEFKRVYLDWLEASPDAASRVAGDAEEILASNIGYLSGYAGAEDAARIRESFDVSHPIFGRQTPTAEDALAAGVAEGKRQIAEGAK